MSAIKKEINHHSQQAAYLLIACCHKGSWQSITQIWCSFSQKSSVSASIGTPPMWQLLQQLLIN